jgi:hypothetical protein
MDHTEDAGLDEINRPPPWRHVAPEKIELGFAPRCTTAVRGLCGHAEAGRGSVGRPAVRRLVAFFARLGFGRGVVVRGTPPTTEGNRPSFPLVHRVFFI